MHATRVPTYGLTPFRYKALIVEGSGNGYLKTVCDYVHLNPVRAKLVGPEEPLQRYPWTSFREYLEEPSARAAWLRVDRLLGEHCVMKDGAAGRGQFQKRMEARRLIEQGQDAGKGIGVTFEKALGSPSNN